MGQVNLIELYPLSFEEFLAATDGPLYAYYARVKKHQQIEEVFHNRLFGAYSYYLIIGGLPECVASWARYKGPRRIQQIQKELITIYENDFSKHNGKVNSGRILLVFRSVVSQLAKGNENFILQQLQGQFDVGPRFFADGRGEVDFLIQNGAEIIPVEVKGGEDKSAASFKAYIKNRRPGTAVRYSRRGYSEEGNITNLPLYLAGMTKELI